ncbi:MAG: Inner rane protein alx [Phycisphaerales bacterium]|nr:Inner rane protein alx [Phycisphaerales bacterium]
MLWMWLGFLSLIGTLLALDLGVLNRRAHAVGLKEALAWSAGWIALAIAFSVFIYFGYEYRWLGLGAVVDGADGMLNDGKSAVAKYLTGYLVEKSLSVDNIFVIALLFASLAIPNRFQHRVLFWGIFGAMAFRGVMIAAGAALVGRYHWLLYAFGAFLLITAARLLFAGEKPADPGKSWVVKFARKWFPFTGEFHGQRFLARVKGRRLLTPLALALIAVEATDVIFAVDSIPAIFAITTDPFLVFTSNTFALLGLRSLYFALAGMMATFAYLKPALAAVLAVIGGKMLAGEWLEEAVGPRHNLWLLLVVAGILAVGVMASLAARHRARRVSLANNKANTAQTDRAAGIERRRA